MRSEMHWAGLGQARRTHALDMHGMPHSGSSVAGGGTTVVAIAHDEPTNIVERAEFPHRNAR